MNELKPCPFCGNDVKLNMRPLWSGSHGYPGKYEYDIHCENPDCGCNIKLPQNNTIYWSDDEARENAIKAWNKRAE